MLVNAIGYLSEAAYHHPDLSVTWGRITVKLSTHSAGGITDKDFALARTDRGRRAVASGRRGCARRDAEQVRAQRRSRARWREAAPAARPVRHRPAGRAGVAAYARRDGRAVCLRRRRAADHGGGADDHDLDRAPSDGERGNGPRADPRALRRRSRRDSGQGRRARGKGAGRPARDSALLRSICDRPGIRRLGHRDPRRDQQRPAADTRGHPAGGRALSRLRRRRHRHRMHARARVSGAWRRRARARRCRDAGERRHLRCR